MYKIIWINTDAKELGYTPNLILGARQINNGMGKYIAEQTVKSMIKNDIKVKNADVLILGVTFKEDCPDMRNTKVVDIIEELKEYAQINLAKYKKAQEEYENAFDESEEILIEDDIELYKTRVRSAKAKIRELEAQED